MPMETAIIPEHLPLERASLKGLITLHPDEITREVRPGAYCYISGRTGFALARLGGMAQSSQGQRYYMVHRISDDAEIQVSDPRLIAFIIDSEPLEPSGRQARR